MFLQILTYELKYRFTRISTHVYFGMLFLLAFLTIHAMGGVFDGVNVIVAGAGTKLHVNSPYVLNALIQTISLIGLMITASFMGQAIYRDYESKMDPLVFTCPISKFNYLGGRFTGALIANLYIFLGIALGLMLATFMPWMDAERFGPTWLAAYTQPYLTLVLPNLLFTGAIFFALAALTRKMLPNYIGGVVLLVGYLLAGNLISDIENDTIAGLIDPFGGQAMYLLTRYWTLVEQNTQLIPLEGHLLYNRLLWVGIGLLLFAVLTWLFKFSHGTSGGRRKKKAEADATPAAVIRRLSLPQVAQSFSFKMHLKQYRTATRREFWTIVRDVYFYAIVGAGLIFLVVSATQLGKVFGTSTFPVTYSVLDVLGGTFTLFMLIIITFYAGELVWNERDLKANQLHDTLPIPNWIPFASKTSALALVCALLMATVMVVGILTQAFKGYFNFEVGLYAKELFGVRLIDFWLLCVLALLVQVLVNHKYVGHFIMIAYYVFSIFMDQMGLQHNLYDYGADPGTTYSDMNKYAHFLFPFSWFKLYWVAFALVLATLSNLWWVRGEEEHLKWRFKLARLRLSRPVVLELGVALLVFVGIGAYIFYNTNVLNEYETSLEQERETVRYEQTYKRYEGIPQPRITDINVDVDIFPRERDVHIRGQYVMKNKTAVAIDSIHVRLLPQMAINAMAFDRGHTRVLADSALGYYIYALDAPLAPGDTLGLDFDLAYLTKGFVNSSSPTQVVYNGTFFNSSVMPHLGYDARGELSGDDTRRKHDLPPKERMAAIDDSVARMNNYIANDADWVNFETTVSTILDQIALAPGYLQREWTEGGRRYFHYKMDAPILHFYAYLSAEYAVYRDTWNGPDGDVAIEIYYHPEHTYNLERMAESVKKSLDYFTANFSPYQHRQVRILEFPRYASFAQSFPNTIPYSESIGFIARIEDPEEDIDYPFYVTAHEVAHQWWAHQVIGGNVQGSTVMSETMSQYSALMVMEKEYGKDVMKRFLEYELNSYLIGRGAERKKELPLLKVENQGYIHYRKGSLVMYALRDYIGEDSLNAALSRYIADVAFQEPPYTNALEFLDHIRAVTPDSLQYVLEDLFETITLYENRTTAATYTLTPDSLYTVDLILEARKVRADSLGNETTIPMQDWIDVGIFGEEEVDGKTREVPLYLQKHMITADKTELRLTVDRLPVRAGIDPYFKLIDRSTDDNVRRVTQQE